MPRRTVRSFEQATAADAEALLDLERAASLVALAHVFPPEQHPYPSAEVLSRWRLVLADPAVTTLVLRDPDAARLLAFVAFDAHRVRHLAVHPDHWGCGLARRALDLGTPRMTAPRLWVLRDNHRARGLYTHLGWRPTGREQPAEFPPYPVEVELVLDR